MALNDGWWTGKVDGKVIDAKFCVVIVYLTRIMSHIFHCIRTLYSTHTNNTYRCHKVTVLAKDVTSNLLGEETYDYISNVPSLTICEL